MQCDANRNIQIWDVNGDSPCARFDLPPGKNKVTLQNMVVDNNASFVIIPFNGDETFGLVYLNSGRFFNLILGLLPFTY